MKFLKLSIASVLFLGITTVISCKKDDKKVVPSESCTNNGYLKFLKTGNKLTYEYTEFFSDDTTLTMEIVSEASGVFKFNLTGGGSFTSSMPNRYMKECNDYLLVNTTGNPTSTADKSYPLVRKTGDKFKVGTSNNYEVLEAGVSLTTKAGTFVCDKMLYTQTGTINEDTIYFSNDIGYVKYVGLLLEYELKSKNF